MVDPDYTDTLIPESPPAPVHVPLSGPDGLTYTSEPQASDMTATVIDLQAARRARDSGSSGRRADAGGSAARYG
jgi:hypothetical protein